MEDDKRDDDRIAILGELQGEIMVFEQMLIKDMSRSGATVETRYSLALNSLHDVRLTLGGNSIIVKGRVVHSRISDVDQDVVTYQTGLEFVEASERAVSVIADFLNTLKSKRSPTPAS